MRSKCTLFLLLSFIWISLQDVGELRDKIKRGEIPVKGVNLGGWLVAEHWMTRGSPIWDKVDENTANGGEYVTMKQMGHAEGDRRFDEHRSKFITEQDFKDISSHGLNTVRIPVGFWIVGFDKSGGGDQEGWKVYAPGALNYLDKAIKEWAPRNNLVVQLSMHAAKGSQNGMDHSAPKDPGQSNWYAYKENVNNTLDAVSWLADRYKNEPSFLGMGMLNEPNQDKYDQVLRQYYYDAYGRIRNDVKSDCLLVTFPFLNQQGVIDSWQNFMRYPDFFNMRHEWHKYTVWGFEAKNGWNAGKIINYVRNDLKNEISSWKGNWLFMGEWSLATDGSVPMNDDELRQLGQAQMEALSKVTGGWTFWSWKFFNDDGGKNAWSMKSMIQHGFLPNKF